MSKWIDRNKLLCILNEGWELGASDIYGRGRRYWVQQGGLCKGGNVVAVHPKTIEKLRIDKKIKIAKFKNDPFWLTRYKLICQ
jgi:hypothetical protein